MTHAASSLALTPGEASGIVNAHLGDDTVHTITVTKVRVIATDKEAYMIEALRP